MLKCFSNVIRGNARGQGHGQCWRGSWRRGLGCQPQKEASMIKKHNRKIVKYHSNTVMAIPGIYTHKTDLKNLKIISCV